MSCVLVGVGASCGCKCSARGFKFFHVGASFQLALPRHDENLVATRDTMKPCHHGEREVPDSQGAIAHQGLHEAAVTGQLLEDHWPVALYERLTSQHAARDRPALPLSTAVNNRPLGRARHGNNAPE